MGNHLHEDQKTHSNALQSPKDRFRSSGLSPESSCSGNLLLRWTAFASQLSWPSGKEVVSVRLKSVGYSNSWTSGASPRVAKGAAGSIADVRYATEVSQAAQYSPSLKTDWGEKRRTDWRVKVPHQAFFLCQIRWRLLKMEIFLLI